MLTAVPKVKREECPKYLEWIKRCVCAIRDCENSPSDPHHVNREGHGGKGIKADDKRAIPLCHEHHREYHDNGRETFARKYRIDYEATITAHNRVWANQNQ